MGTKIALATLLYCSVFMASSRRVCDISLAFVPRNATYPTKITVSVPNSTANQETPGQQINSGPIPCFSQISSQLIKQLILLYKVTQLHWFTYSIIYTTLVCNETKARLQAESWRGSCICNKHSRGSLGQNQSQRPRKDLVGSMRSEKLFLFLKLMLQCIQSKPWCIQKTEGMK